MTSGFAAFAITHSHLRCISNETPSSEARDATDSRSIDARLAAVSSRPCHRQFIHQPEYLSAARFPASSRLHTFSVSRAIKLLVLPNVVVLLTFSVFDNKKIYIYIHFLFSSSKTELYICESCRE